MSKQQEKQQKKQKQQKQDKQDNKEYRIVFVRLVREYVKPNIGWFIMAFALAAIAGATTGATMQMLKPVLDEMFLSKNLNRLAILAVFVIGIFLLKGTCTYFQQFVMARVGSEVVKDMQMRLTRKLLSQSMRFFNHKNSGDLQMAFQMQTMMIRSSLDHIVVSVRDVVSVISLLFVMFYNNWQLSIVSLFILPIAIGPLRKLMKKMRNLGKDFNSGAGMLMTVVGETFRNIKLVQSYTQEEKEYNRIEESANMLKNIMINRQRVVSLTSPLMETLGGVAIGIVILYGGYQVATQGVETSSFMVFIGSFLVAYEPIKRLSRVNVEIQMGLTATKSIYEYIDAVPIIADSKDAQELNAKDGEILLENIHFSYHGPKDKHPPALRDINLKVPAGKTVALVGQSGSGKSTLVTLIQRFWDPNKGRVLIDGQDVKYVTLHSLRKNISYVGQEVILFDTTVKENIAYGNNNATMDDIILAAKNANAHEFIEKLPKKYDTMIGEQGVLLSGGQRQRLSIARAMIKESPILLLDEATSALDTESERLVQDALENLMENRTVVVIAHRLSTIISADIICVMRDGSIIEKGTHQELLAQDGAYKKMYDVQFKG